MRVNLNTGFLALIALLLFTLLLFVRHAQNELSDQTLPATSSLTSIRSTWTPSNVDERLRLIRKRLDMFEQLSSQRSQELRQLQSLLQKLISHVHRSVMTYSSVSVSNDSFTKRPTADQAFDFNKIQSKNWIQSGAHSQHLELPHIAQFLDQLLFFDGSIDPVFYRDNQQNRRIDVDLVFGIPTVQRSKESYLLPTLKNLIDNLDEEGQKRSLFVVFIAEASCTCCSRNS